MPNVDMVIEKSRKSEGNHQSKRDSKENNFTNILGHNEHIRKIDTWKELAYLEDNVDLERNPFI